MIDDTAVQLKLRERFLSLVVSTVTPSTAISATKTGFARVSGSFLDEGFAPGMEVTGAGFRNAANNAAKIIIGVTATTLMTRDGAVAEAAATTKVLTVRVPETRAWELMQTDPAADRPFVAEAFAPATQRLRGTSSNGVLDVTAVYKILWYALPNMSLRSQSLPMDRLARLFKVGTTIPLPSGDVIRVRTDIGPRPTDARRVDSWSLRTFEIPLWWMTMNDG
jgi:hypothetical protein